MGMKKRTDVDNVVTLNQKDTYVIGSLVIKKAWTKQKAVELSKSYIDSANKMVKCGILKKTNNKYWLKHKT